MRTPKWGDGNDVASTPAPVIEQAMTTGWLPARVYKDFEGVRGYYVQPTAAAAIRVIVDSTPQGARTAGHRAPVPADKRATH
jgi:hypothetical protein